MRRSGLKSDRRAIPGFFPDLTNFTALTECARKIKNARPEFKEETQVTISANPGIDYKIIIDTMDALRSDGTEELFPEVHFGVVR